MDKEVLFYSNYLKIVSKMEHASKVVRALFLKYWERDKNIPWRDTMARSFDYFRNEGQHVWISASRRQKLLLQKGNSQVWDLKLLNLVLQSAGSSKPFVTEQEKASLNILVDIYKEEILRNYDFNLDSERAKKLMVKIRKCLEVLNPNDYLKIDDPVAPSSSSADQAANIQNDIAVLFGKGKFSKLIDFAELLNLSDFSNKDLCVIYLTVASAYLNVKVYEEIVDLYSEREKYYMAVEYSKRAVHLCPMWSKAHAGMGRAYAALRKCRKAVKHLLLACELNKNAACEDVVNVIGIPEEGYEGIVVEKREKRETLINSMKEHGLKMINLSLADPDVLTCNDINVEAFKCLNGQDCAYSEGKLNDENRIIAAFSIFQSSTECIDDIDNSEALYYLGMMCRLGWGTIVDLQKSLKCFKQAVDKSLCKRKEDQPESYGYSQAEYQLGYCYEKGLAVEQSLTIAVEYYNRAALHNCIRAKGKLGDLYMFGRGVVRDVRKAIQCWTEAAALRDIISCKALANYYICVEENTETARKYHDQLPLPNNCVSRIEKSGFENKTEKLIKLHAENFKGMVRWEMFNDIKIENRSLRQRRDKFRMMTSDGKEGDADVYFEFSVNLDKILTGDDAEIVEGSEAADRVRQACGYIKTGLKLVKRLKDEVIANIKETEREAVIFFANGLHLYDKILAWNEVTDHDATKLIWRLEAASSEIEGEEAQKEETKTFDRDVRICCASSLVTFSAAAKRYLGECIAKHPKEVWFCICLCHCLGRAKEYKEGAKVAMESLHKFPENSTLMYYKASYLHRLNTQNVRSNGVITAFNAFLAKADEENFRVPLAYYSMAVECLRDNTTVNIDEPADYYRKGIRAEKRLLPFFHSTSINLKAKVESYSIMAIDVAREQMLADADDLTSNFMKAHLDDLPKLMVNCHRAGISASKKSYEPDPSKGTGPNKLEVLRKLTFNNMDFVTGCNYPFAEVECEVIDNVMITENGYLQLLVQDNEKVYQSCIITNPEVPFHLDYGSKIVVVEPSVRFDVDGRVKIFVDNVKYLYCDALPNANRCRFCGEMGVMICARCNLAAYCSDSCLNNDGKMLGHGWICEKMKTARL